MRSYDETSSDSSDPVRTGLRPWLALLALVLAMAISLYFFAAVYQLRLSPTWLNDLRYLLLDPESGFLGMVLALFVLFTVPALLIRLSARRRRGRTQGESASSSGAAGGPVFTSDIDEDQIEVASMALREMGAGVRWEMADALGIPWRDELILDHASWEAACREATDQEAARIRR